MSKGEGNIQEAILPNGLKVLILEEHSFPVFSSMVFTVLDLATKIWAKGLSHPVEHLLFDRVGKYRKGEIGAIIARNGGMFNGFTSDDFTVYFETMAPTKLDLALKIEADRMRLANFSQEEVAAEIKRIEKELELEAKDQANLLVKEVRSAAFQRHPYKNPTIGWSTDVQKLTFDDVKRHYKEYYQPGNATLVIVGDIDATAALANVRKHFAGIAAGELPRPLRVVEPAQRAEKRVYLKYGGAADVLSWLITPQLLPTMMP
ncbi:MAG: insulinase family protein [Candidatus Obscuribacter sp.]|nr:insulinase family protein [Candidatus Obscuribacter sp.]